MAPAMKNHMSVETTREAIPLGREEGVPMAAPQGIERKGTGVITCSASGGFLNSCFPLGMVVIGTAPRVGMMITMGVTKAEVVAIDRAMSLLWKDHAYSSSLAPKQW